MQLVLLALCASCLGKALCQTTNDEASSPVGPRAWSFLVSTSGYLIPDGQSYASPTFVADRRRLHLETRYNNEAQQTGSLWAGVNLRAGDKLAFELTPIAGVVFGKMTGFAPGSELALTYKQFQLSSQLEFVIDIADKNRSFLYSWNEFVYSPAKWFHAGLASQRTRAYQTDLDVQRGFSAGVVHKATDFTTYVFNAGWTTPTIVLTLNQRF